MGKGRKTPKGKKAMGVKDLAPKGGRHIKGGAVPVNSVKLK